MKKYLLSSALLGLVACGTPDLCDREAQEWFKFGTQEDTCERLPIVVGDIPESSGDGPSGSIGLPDMESPRVSHKESPKGTRSHSEKPTGKPSNGNTPKRGGNNGWGNGDQPAPGKSKERNRAENSTNSHAKFGPGRKD